MVDFVMDRGLDQLLAQINEAAPGRSKASDGGVGDADHALRESQHNPESPPPPGNPDDQVDARDFTHDPAHGADMGVVSEAIRQSRDVRVHYVIFNGRIFSSYATNGRNAWEWGTYTGTNMHRSHMHVSVNDIHHDETQRWKIGIDMAESVGAIAEQYRILALMTLDPKHANSTRIVAEGRLATVPLIDLLKRVDANVTALSEGSGAPLEVVLSTDQLGQLADMIVARLGALQFMGRPA